MDVSGSALYLLDTNMAAYIVSGRSKIARQKLKEQRDCSTVALSTISQAEILFGLENKPEAVRLRSAVQQLFGTVQILSWDSAAAQAYGRLLARLSAAGKSLTAMDMLIAAHAMATSAILVTRDKAFMQTTPFLNVEDWATDL